MHFGIMEDTNHAAEWLVIHKMLTKSTKDWVFKNSDQSNDCLAATVGVYFGVLVEVLEKCPHAKCIHSASPTSPSLLLMNRVKVWPKYVLLWPRWNNVSFFCNTIKKLAIILRVQDHTFNYWNWRLYGTSI